PAEHRRRPAARGSGAGAAADAAGDERAGAREDAGRAQGSTAARAVGPGLGPCAARARCRDAGRTCQVIRHPQPGSARRLTDSGTASPLEVREAVLDEIHHVAAAAEHAAARVEPVLLGAAADADDAEVVVDHAPERSARPALAAGMAVGDLQLQARIVI